MLRIVSLVLLQMVTQPTLFELQLGVVVGWPCSAAEGFRRRAQFLTWCESVTLLYRSLLPVPVWYKYFEDSGMGVVLCALTTGEAPS